MECYTYLRNIQDPLSDGKTPCERRFGEPFKGPIIPFGSLVEYHPIRIHQTLNEERNKKFFEENQTDSLLQPPFKMTQHAMMRKLKMSFGLLREISFVAITWNPESNCTCRKKNHFLFR